jgi:4-amino-4-deoxy-L-arabinose transferase-like glycosyltransferase
MFREVREALRRVLDIPGAIFFGAALLLYLPAIWWGLTYATAGPRAYPWGADELAPLQSVTELYGIFFARQPHFNPQYPPFHNLMQALLVGPYLAYLWVTGGLRHPQPLYPFGLVNPLAALRVTTLLARAVSWVMAAGVVLTAYRTGIVLRDRLTGIISALLVMSLYPMFYYSRVSNVDMGALFWTSLGLYVFALCLRDGLSTRRAIWLGVFAALATASKDPSWAAFFMAGIVLLCRELRWPLTTTPREKLRPLIAGLLVAIGTYAAVSGVIFRPSRYIEHMRRITQNVISPQYQEPSTLSGYGRLIQDIGTNLIDSMGVPEGICVVAGLLFVFFRRRQLQNWVWPAVGIILLVLFPARFVLLRFVLIVAYVLAFFAAIALREAYDRPGWRRAAPVLLVLVSGWSLVRGEDLTWQMLHDGRYTAAAWLHQHAHPGDRVLHFGPPGNLPALDTGVRNILAKAGTPYHFSGTHDDPEFVILIPFELFPSELEHEPNLSEPDYRALRAGTLGYHEVVQAQAPRLFYKRPIPFVNPPVQLFARNDVLERR